MNDAIPNRKREKKGGKISIINSPAVFVEEILARRLERVVWPQVLDRHGYAGHRVDRRLLEILCDADAVEAVAGDGHDRVVHDFEGDVVDQIVRDDLRRQYKFKTDKEILKKKKKKTYPFLDFTTRCTFKSITHILNLLGGFLTKRLLVFVETDFANLTIGQLPIQFVQ